GESAIVHVGGNHFISVSKNEDGTFTLFDINNPNNKVNLRTKEELSALLRVYLGGNSTTTVLAKANSIFNSNKIKGELFNVIGGTIDDVVAYTRDPSKAAEFYLKYGDKAYIEFMKVMFNGKTDLNDVESESFVKAYQLFLEQAIKGLSKEADSKDHQSNIDNLNKDIDAIKRDIDAIKEAISDLRDKISNSERWGYGYPMNGYIALENMEGLLKEREGELAKKEQELIDVKSKPQKILALIDEAAYNLAVMQKVKEILTDPKYYIPGKGGPILSGKAGQVLIPAICVDMSGKGLPGGEYYLVINVEASYGGTRSVEYGGGSNEKRDIPKYVVSANDIRTSVSTKEGGTVTLEDGSTYKIFGVPGTFEGQNVIFEYFGYYRGSTNEFFMSSDACVYLADSKGHLYQPKGDPSASPPASGKYGNGAPPRDNWSRGIITEDDNGYMIRGAGSRVSIKKDASTGKWDAVIVGLGTEALSGSTLKVGSKDKFGNDNNVYINIQVGKMTYAGSYWAASDGMVWNFDSVKSTQAKAEAYAVSILFNQLSGDGNKDFVGKITLINGHIDLSKTFYGAPFSSTSIMHECGLEYKIELKKGYSYDATQKGEVFKIIFDQDTVVVLKEKDYILRYYATEDIKVNVELPDGWEFKNESELKNGSKFMSGVTINSGQEISLGIVLYNTKTSIENTEEIEVIIGYEEKGNGEKDENGNPKLDYSKPITSKIKKGELKITGDDEGGYATSGDIGIDFTDTGWIVSNRSKHHWNAGAKVSLIRTKDENGDIIYRMSITEGTLHVEGLNDVHVPKGKGGENKDKPEYKGPHFEGKVGTARDDGNGGHYYGGISGDFIGVCGVGLTKDSLGNYLFAPGSKLKEGSYAPDGTKSKYRFVIKSDGSIEQKDVKWYDKLAGALLAIVKIIVSVIVAIVVAMFVITLLTSILLPIIGVALGISFGVDGDKTKEFFTKTLGNIFKDWAASIYDDWNLREGSDHNTETAWKGGFAMVAAGFMAIVTAAIAIASVVSSLFTGGVSLAAGIAAIIGVISAIAGAIQVGQMTYQAVVALEYGDLKSGLLMLGAAIILAAVTIVGGKGVGKAISKGLESVGFVLKAAIKGAVIGTGVGAGVGALGNYIAYGWANDEWTGEGAAEAAEEGSITGAITGFFAGASLGIGIASSIVKQAARETAEAVAGAAAEGVGEGAAEGVGTGVAEAAGEGVGAAAPRVLGVAGAEGAGAVAPRALGAAVPRALGAAAGEGAGVAGAEGVGTGAARGAAQGAAEGIGTGAARGAAQGAAEGIGKAITEGVGVSFKEGLSLLGRSIKFFITDISLVPVTGVKTFLVNAIRVVAHTLRIIFELGSMALNLFISYQAAGSMVEGIKGMIKANKEGGIDDFLDSLELFFSAGWTLVSINVISPFMSGQSGVQELSDVGRAEGTQIAAARSIGSESLVYSLEDARTIFTSARAWGYHILTGVVGAGVGVAAVYLVAWASSENGKLDVDLKDVLLKGVLAGFVSGVGLSMLSHLFVEGGVGAKLVDGIKKTFGPMTGYSEATGTRTLINFGKVWGSGLVGAVIGAGVVPFVVWLFGDGTAEEVDEEDEESEGDSEGQDRKGKYKQKKNYAMLALIGAGVGLVAGIGFGGAWINGKYTGLIGRIKASLFGSISQGEAGKLPLIARFESPIAMNALRMSISMSLMSTRLTFAAAAINRLLTWMGFEKIISSKGPFGVIDKITGLGIFEKSEDLVEKNFSRDCMNDFFKASFAQLRNPQTKVFVVFIAVLQPILTPALMNSPIVGTIMHPIASAGNAGFMQNETIKYFYENGIKERLSGVLGKLIFGDSMAAEIFQELFDETPDDMNKTKIEQLEFLASHGFDSDKILHAIDLLKSSDPLKLKENMIGAFKTLGVDKIPAVEIDIIIERFFVQYGFKLEDIKILDTLRQVRRQMQKLELEMKEAGVGKKDLTEEENAELIRLKDMEKRDTGQETKFKELTLRDQYSSLKYLEVETNKVLKEMSKQFKSIASEENLTRFILNEVAIYKLKLAGVNVSDTDIDKIKQVEIPEDLSINEQLNYLYSLYGFSCLGLDISLIGKLKYGDILTFLESKNVKDNKDEGIKNKEKIAYELLLNYASVISNIPGRKQEILAIAKILVKAFNNIDSKNVEAKTLFMAQYLNVLIGSMDLTFTKEEELEDAKFIYDFENAIDEINKLGSLGMLTEEQVERLEKLKSFAEAKEFQRLLDPFEPGKDTDTKLFERLDRKGDELRQILNRYNSTKGKYPENDLILLITQYSIKGDMQKAVDRLFDIVGEHMVTTFKDSESLKHARAVYLTDLGNARTPQQQAELDAFKLSEGEIEVLRKSYSPETLALNNYINIIISKVESGEISYAQFRSLMDIGDEVYFKGGNAKTNEYRVQLRKLMVAESNNFIKSIDKLFDDGHISKEDARMLKEQVFYSRFAIAPTSYLNVSTAIRSRIQDLTPATELMLKLDDGSFKVFKIEDIDRDGINIVGQNLSNARLSFSVNGEPIEGALRGNLNSLAANKGFVELIMPQMRKFLSTMFLSDAAVVNAGITSDINLFYSAAKIEAAFAEINQSETVTWDMLARELLQDGRLRTDIFDDTGNLNSNTIQRIRECFDFNEDPTVADKFIAVVTSIAKDSQNLHLSFDDDGNLTEDFSAKIINELGDAIATRFIGAVNTKYSVIVKTLSLRDSFEADGSLKNSVINSLKQPMLDIVKSFVQLRTQLLDDILQHKDFIDGKMSQADITEFISKMPLGKNQKMVEYLVLSIQRTQDLLLAYTTQPAEMLRALAGNFAKSPLSKINHFSMDENGIQMSDVDLYMLLQAVGRGNLTGAIADLKSLKSLRSELEGLTTSELTSDTLAKAFELSPDIKNAIKEILEKPGSIEKDKLSGNAKSEIRKVLTEKGVDGAKIQKIIDNVDSVYGKMEKLKLNPGSNLAVFDFALPEMVGVLFRSLNIAVQDQKKIKEALFDKQDRVREDAREGIEALAIDGKYKIEIQKLLAVADLIKDITIFSKNGDLTPEAKSILEVNFNDSSLEFKTVLEKAFSEDKAIRAALKSEESKVNSIAVKIKYLEGMLKALFENSGYSDNIEALLPRLEYLQKQENLSRIRTMFRGTDNREFSDNEIKDISKMVGSIVDNFSKGIFNPEDIKYLRDVGVANFVKAFLNGCIADRDSKGKVTKFNDGTLDLLRSLVLNMEKNNLKEESANLLKIFMIEANTMVNYGLRPSQAEMVSHFQNNDNVAVGMGGGKTISIAIDAVITRVLMGKDANIEILVGNEDLNNYAARGKAAKKFFDSLGMKAVKIDDFKPEGEDTNLDGLKAAYSDPDTIV
ncbi:MAG: hypothetical protein LBD17_04775, partial [Endomicrobium sp.]|nr:hypothetical protein [Endomicrobium sp.]